MLRRALIGGPLLALLASAALAPAAGAGANAAAGVSGLDESYLQTGMQGDIFEIKGGKIAQRNGSTPQAKALGARLIRDHRASLKEARALARSLHISIPTGPTPPEAWELAIVKTLSGRTFDRWYADLEVQDHKQDISEASDERDKGSNPRVRSSARTELPMLAAHLRLSRALLKASGGPFAG